MVNGSHHELVAVRALVLAVGWKRFQCVLESTEGGLEEFDNFIA